MAVGQSTRILTMNSGSSSLKFAVFHMGPAESLALSGRMERIGLSGGVFHAKGPDQATLLDRPLELPDHAAAFKALFDWLQNQADAENLDAVGHRLVHGGTEHTRPERITPELVESLRKLVPLAPEHLPHEIDAIEAVGRLHPGLAQVACFDTAFHQSMPPEARDYSFPKDLGVRRFGFHGLSYEYIMTELRKNAGAKTADGRIVIAHLGNGASMAAVMQGRCLDTTMGFTPAGGLVMSTRTGDLDPGVVLYLLREKQLSVSAVDELVNRKAGLLGISETSSDMVDLLARESADPRAREAVDVFCRQAKKFLASLAAVLGGLDTLVFTAGIGENAAAVRERIGAGLAFLGIAVDPERNRANAAIISPEGSAVTVRVMKTNEELMIARHTSATIRGAANST